MSTRCTISYSDDFHLYEECFDRDNVYLCLDNGDWSAALETATVDWRDGNSRRPSLHVRMGVDLWRQIVDGWVKSHWAQHPERDHEQVEFDGGWLSKLAGKGDEAAQPSCKEDKQ